MTTNEPRWLRRGLIALALAFIAFFPLLPLVAVFVEALRQGFGAYLRALQEPDAWSALKLRLIGYWAHLLCKRWV